jgi:hypothetical protein
LPLGGLVSESPSQNPKLSAVFERAQAATASAIKGLMASTSKTPNVSQGPHGYIAFITGGSRVIVD